MNPVDLINWQQDLVTQHLLKLLRERREELRAMLTTLKYDADSLADANRAVGICEAIEDIVSLDIFNQPGEVEDEE